MGENFAVERNRGNSTGEYTWASARPLRIGRASDHELEARRIWQRSITDTRDSVAPLSESEPIPYVERADRCPIRCMRGPSPWVIKHSCTAGHFPRAAPPQQPRMRLLIFLPLDATYRASTIRNRLFMAKKDGQIFGPLFVPAYPVTLVPFPGRSTSPSQPPVPGTKHDRPYVQ